MLSDDSLENFPYQLTSSVRLVTLWTTSARVNRITSHRMWPIDTVKLKVESARIADHLTAKISSPNCGGGRSAVCARQILLWALLVVVFRTRVVVVALRGVLVARPDIVERRIAKLIRADGQWWSAANFLSSFLQSRAAWARLLSSASLFLCILWGEKWEYYSVLSSNMFNFMYRVCAIKYLE